MTESSGVFTFPATGYWRIDCQFYFQILTTSSAYGRGEIQVSTNTGSDWSIASSCNASMTDSTVSDHSSANVYVTHQFDVTSTSTHLVRFVVSQETASGYLNGNSDHTFTGFTFTHLGNT